MMGIPRNLILSAFLFIPLLAGCFTVHEVVTSDPYDADIYWGESKETLVKSVVKTPYSKIHRGTALESRCFQVRKKGYHKSEIASRTSEDYRHVHFDLKPLTTTITSNPQGATIYWGPTREDLKRTKYETPFIVKDDRTGASWRDWYFHVRQDGYPDPEIVFLATQTTDRHVHFGLEALEEDKPKPDPGPPGTKPGTQVTLRWEDHSSNEQGFKVERKDGPDGRYREIATVGRDITTYTDKGRVPGETYYYRIRAFNQIGHSAYTDEIRYEVPRM